MVVLTEENWAIPYFSITHIYKLVTFALLILF
jgi:hypothetical protein